MITKRGNNPSVSVHSTRNFQDYYGVDAVPFGHQVHIYEALYMSESK